ncbi:hypothetical protein C2E19_04175 [Pseudomonas sp. DTU12.3]|nr:hypothetical protein C2E19_04175 [Pseudomonas sp. DTU12.3]
MSGVLFNRPLTLTLSRRERGLTEVFGRCATTCEFEPNSSFEKHEDRLPFPLPHPLEIEGTDRGVWTMCYDLRIRAELKL